MNLRRQESRRPSIRQKDVGQVEWLVGIFFVIILIILMYTQLQLAAWHSASVYLEDALAASNLASALINVEEYGRTKKVLLFSEADAYEIYQEALQTNLGLDDTWQCSNESLLKGPIEIVNYTIYNVIDNQVETLQIGADGQVVERNTGALGTVRAPNGLVVEHTGIYSELQFLVEGFPGMYIEARKGKLVDIVSD